MGATEARSNLWRWGVILASLAVSVAFVYLAVANLDLARVGDALARVELWPWAPLSLGCYVLAHFVRGWRCRELVSLEAALTVPAATNVVVVGYAVNNLLPGRLGELFRASVLAERTGLPFVQSLTVTLLERLLDALVILVLFVLATWAVRVTGETPVVLDTVSGLVLMAASGVAALLVAGNAIVSIVARVGGLFGEHVRDRLVATVWRVAAGVAYLRSPARAAVVAGASLVAWLFEVGLFLFWMPAFGLPFDPWWALVVMGVTNLGILVPSSPGYIGPFHYFVMTALVMLGANAETALTYAIVVHLTFYLPVTLWGAGILVGEGVALGQRASLLRASKGMVAPSELAERAATRLSASRRRTEGTASWRFIEACVDAIVPAEVPDLTAEERDAAAAQAAQFVTRQLAALPARERFLFRCGCLAFQVWAFVRYAGRFEREPRDVRRRAIRAWAAGPWHLGRLLFKPVVAIGLFAFWESWSPAAAPS